MPSLQERVAEFMGGLGFTWKWDYPGGKTGLWLRDNGEIIEHVVDKDEATFWYKQSLEARKDALQKILDKSSGGGNWRRYIITELATLDQLLKEEGTG